MKIAFIISFILWIGAGVGAAQSIADKNTYLVDSLNLEALGSDERMLLDSLTGLFHQTDSDTLQLHYLDQMVKGIYAPEVWTKYNNLILRMTDDILKQRPDDEKVLAYRAGALNDKGFELVEGRPAAAKEYYDRALSIWKQIGDSAGIANTQNNLGTVYGKMGDISKALDYFQQSLSMREKLGNHRGVATCLMNISHIYDDQGEKEKALEYLYRALGIFKQIDYVQGECTTLNNIAATYTQLGKLDTAITLYNQSLKLSAEHNIFPLIVTANNNLGSLYAKQLGEHEKALEYYEKALAMLEQVSYKRGLATVSYNIGKSHFELGNTPEALRYGKQSMALAQELGFPFELKNAANLLHLVYDQKGEHEKSLAYYKQFVDMRDSLTNESTQKEALKRSMEYDFEKQTLAREKEYEKQMALAQAQKEQQQIMLWSAVIIALLIALFLIVFVHRLRITQKQKGIIEQKNEENELLLGEIHHRVKNNLQMISSLLSLQQRNVEDPKAKDALADGRNRVLSMALVHKKLYQQDGFSTIEMFDYTRQLTDELLAGLNPEGREVEVSTSIDNVKLDVDTAVPIGLIINELLVNSLKYAFEGVATPKINITLKEEKGTLYMKYEDNGTANEQVVQKVQAGSSFGSKMIASLTRQLNGTKEVLAQGGLAYVFSFKEYRIHP